MFFYFLFQIQHPVLPRMRHTLNLHITQRRSILTQAFFHSYVTEATSSTERILHYV